LTLPLLTGGENATGLKLQTSVALFTFKVNCAGSLHIVWSRKENNYFEAYALDFV